MSYIYGKKCFTTISIYSWRWSFELHDISFISFLELSGTIDDASIMIHGM